MLARRHVVDGQESVVLHDEARHEAVALPPATWAVLACADGTRDVAGIAAAAARVGAGATEAAVAKLLEALHARGALEDGAPPHEPDVVTIRKRPEDVSKQPVAPLPGYRFDCDGSGGCCSAYGSILLTPGDRDRARAALEGETRAGVPMSRWFTPDHGSAPTPLSVPLHVEGGCGFLGEDGLCEIHRRVGLAGKPRACAAFPLVACSDGKEVRVSVTPECACVLRSAGPGRGEPLTESWRAGSDLPPTTVVDVLPAMLDVSKGRMQSRDWVRTQVAEVLAALPTAADPARACWAWADTWSDTTPTEAVLAPYIDSLLPLARDLLRRRSTYVGDADWVLGSLRWLVGTLHLLQEVSLQEMILEASPVGDPTERLYVRSSLWAYRDFIDMPLAGVMRAHAAKIWVGRAMAEVPLAPSETAVPLATLSMLMRGHGLMRAWDEPVEA
ncbi:MAG: YkgJ family cysteine cluster protein [Nannocystales bacterium]